MESNLTPSSGQDSTTNSQSTRNYKRWGIHRMKQHLAGVKGDIGSCKSVPPDGIGQKVKKRFKKCKVLWQLIVEKGKINSG
ncbi:hypothetical protein CK203_089827 [Vitis vinifera]|uniref:Uncharacterized protein n=1 Tax=Vitis vinifera TaxID=29760 RepID=A0A438D3J6_VITVI|nr:hypothetical protein CK203_089827 [Vitis vinifera]